jgi:hypothetical protein
MVGSGQSVGGVVTKTIGASGEVHLAFTLWELNIFGKWGKNGIKLFSCLFLLINDISFGFICISVVIIYCRCVKMPIQLENPNRVNCVIVFVNCMSIFCQINYYAIIYVLSWIKDRNW